MPSKMETLKGLFLNRREHLLTMAKSLEDHGQTYEAACAQMMADQFLYLTHEMDKAFE